MKLNIFPLQLLYKNKHTYLEGNTYLFCRTVGYLPIGYYHLSSTLNCDEYPIQYLLRYSQLYGVSVNLYGAVAST